MLASVSAAGIRTKWTFNGENPFGMLTVNNNNQRRAGLSCI